jgi:asparagine synthase (glutamine-hydrolysing)
MCGIFGMVSPEQAVDRHQVQTLTRMLAHRGPDAEGFYFSPPNGGASAGLGHRRLSIIDLSPKGHQPMCNEDESVWVVFNGEIYDFQTQRRELAARGHIFRSDTDTETIIHLYEEYGPRCLLFLRGMFAFAIWDVRRGILFAARDRVGKKPFYYAQTARGFYFSSEINPLYEAAGVDTRLDPEALDLYLSYGYIPSPRTIVQGIAKLPPAHYLLLRDQRLEIQRYWDLRYAPKLNVPFAEAQRLLDEKISEATRIRLFSDVPLGCFLSGGVDSSLVLANMARLTSRPVKTFSIGFPDKAFDETPYARQAARIFGSEHQEFIVRPAAVEETIARLVRHFGEPFGDASALPTWYLSEMTRKHVTVALNGDGGDELFAGYNWYTTAVGLHQAAHFFPARLAALAAPRLNRFRNNHGVGRKLMRLMELVAKNDAERFADLRCQLANGQKERLYSAAFHRRLGSATERYLNEIYTAHRFEDELDRMLYVDTTTYLPEELLVKVDRATMAHALEGRSPLLDQELMELAAKLPSRFKFRRGRRKHIIRTMAADLFPPGFFDRPKTGFSVPLKAWFSGDLETYAHHSLITGSLAGTMLLDMAYIGQVLEENRSGRRDHGDLIWRLLMLSEWLKSYGRQLDAI